MKKFSEFITEKESEFKIFSQSIIGNFYSSGKYQESLDTIFIKAKDIKSAKKLAEQNIEVIQDMFKNKILHTGKKPALRKKETSLIKIGATDAKDSKMTSFHKVLTSNNKFEKVEL